MADKRGDSGAAGTTEWIKYGGAGAGISLNQRCEAGHGLLRGVQPVAGVVPRQNISRRIFRGQGIPFCQKVSLLMLHLAVADARGVAFDPHEMPDGPKTALFPDRQKTLGFCPTIKADAVGVRLEDPEHFGEGWKQPMGIVIVFNHAPAAVLVTHKVRRVGEYEIHAGVGQSAQLVEAIPVNQPDAGRGGGRRGWCLELPARDRQRFLTWWMGYRSDNFSWEISQL